MHAWHLPGREVADWDFEVALEVHVLPEQDAPRAVWGEVPIWSAKTRTRRPSQPSRPPFYLFESKETFSNKRPVIDNL